MTGIWLYSPILHKAKTLDFPELRVIKIIEISCMGCIGIVGRKKLKEVDGSNHYSTSDENDDPINLYSNQIKLYIVDIRTNKIKSERALSKPLVNIVSLINNPDKPEILALYLDGYGTLNWYIEVL